MKYIVLLENDADYEKAVDEISKVATITNKMELIMAIGVEAESKDNLLSLSCVFGVEDDDETWAL